MSAATLLKSEFLIPEESYEFSAQASAEVGDGTALRSWRVDKLVSTRIALDLDTAVNNYMEEPTLPQTTFQVKTVQPPQTLLAEWNGAVLSVKDHFFIAALKGIAGEGVQGEEEDAEIPLSDVSEFEKDLLQPGNMFRLCVFSEVLKNGQPRRYTQVTFRRLPAYRSKDLEAASQRVDELYSSIRVE